MKEIIVIFILSIIIDLSISALNNPPIWFCIMFGIISYYASCDMINEVWIDKEKQ